MARSAGKATLIYDGACPYCRRAAAWTRRRAVPGTLATLPCQSQRRILRFPTLPEKQCLAAMQLALPNGAVLSGAGALPELLRRLNGWRWVAALFALPGAQTLARPAYRWIAQRRWQWSARTPCDGDRAQKGIGCNHDDVGR